MKHIKYIFEMDNWASSNRLSDSMPPIDKHKEFDRQYRDAVQQYGNGLPIDTVKNMLLSLNFTHDELKKLYWRKGDYDKSTLLGIAIGRAQRETI